MDGGSGGTGDDKHAHFSEEEVKGHEEGHVIREASTKKPAEAGASGEPDVDDDPEVAEHLAEAQRNKDSNSHLV